MKEIEEIEEIRDISEDDKVRFIRSKMRALTPATAILRHRLSNFNMAYLDIMAYLESLSD
jgi:hypothetical protein